MIDDQQKPNQPDTPETANNPQDNKAETQQEQIIFSPEHKAQKQTESATQSEAKVHTTPKAAAEPKASTEKASTENETDQPLKALTPANQLVLPVVPIREGVLFPSTESVLTFGRDISVNAIQESLKTQNMVVLVTQRKASVNNPEPSDLYTIATLAVVERTLNTDDQVNALVRGVGRVEIIRYIKTNPNLVAQVIKIEDTNTRDEEQRALANHLQKEFRRAIHMGKPVEFLNFMKLMSGVTDGELVDQIASTLNVKTKEKQHILETLDVKERMRMVIEHLNRELKVMEIEKDVVHKTQAKFDKHMRENVLRERLKTIQKELGELDDDEEVIGEYEQKLKKTKFPAEVKDKVAKEIRRLKQMSVNNPEAGYIRSWLDTIFELPWGIYADDTVNLDTAESVLHKNHYGLKDVKDRILEFIAVMQLKQKDPKADKGKKVLPTILCFVGPPGVGKTSIGKSIAEALGRKFTKVSLGGVRDEAEIRGHRRTYVGAMPGRIISGIKQAKSSNPVFMLDEIDKLGTDFRGDPSAALLEALDPEQNHTFEDHYLDVPYDLSQVVFITTANTLETIPPALRDRLEIIRYAGYTADEKFHIGKEYLVPKVTTSNAIPAEAVVVSDDILKTIIDRYTKEAGVRSLERNLSKVMRKAAREIVHDHEATKIMIDIKKLQDYLGPEEYDVTLTELDDQVGLATGLAWTSVGGDVLFIEVALTPGKGQVKLTGKLGDVMKESAQAALTFVKANASKLGIKSSVINKTDIHIHVPEGAVPKDGPSAGITMTTAIVSAFTQKPVKREVAMTGEVTLRGRVLRIGGLKEKSIAAHRAGSQIVLIPKDNERDLVEVPDSVKKDITFKPVAHMDEVLKLALKN
ncbi:MAG TPA: endopeptidase La [Vitreimonas sp.]|nr:endopeptidase La [Vitreimonas sp.]